VFSIVSPMTAPKGAEIGANARDEMIRFVAARPDGPNGAHPPTSAPDSRGGFGVGIRAIGPHVLFNNR
jgi:hypothetical protein